MNSFALGRLVLFAILIPLAILLGYLLSSPLSYATMAIVGGLFMLLALPMVLRWHHIFLILSWNAHINVFFLPGKPQMWMVLAFVSLGISLLKRALVPNFRFSSVPLLNWSLFFILAVVLGTASLRGGIGIRSLGGDAYGGRWYIYIIAAIAGYFALTAQRIPKERAHLVVALYWLSAFTGFVSNVAYFLGPKFYFLYLLFPADIALMQAAAELGGSQVITRITGLAVLATGVYCWLFARYGLKGTFDLRYPWRCGVLVLGLGFGMFSGFRSTVIIAILLGVILFFLEGLHRTRAVAWVVAGVLLLGCILVPFASHFPLAIQRSLSFLPIPLDEMARQDAMGSSDWRLQMWNVLIAQIPQYLWLGKGYTLDPAALYLAEQGILRGFLQNYEVALIAGDYHNGPLSLIIPFGIWGVLAFAFFLASGFWVLVRNYRFGDPSIKSLNTFFLAFFLMRTFFFFFLFGAFNAELFLFTGILGLSVAINGGVCKPHRSPVSSASRSFKPVATVGI